MGLYRTNFLYLFKNSISVKLIDTFVYLYDFVGVKCTGFNRKKQINRSIYLFGDIM
jgi:hypothetical protein